MADAQVQSMRQFTTGSDPNIGDTAAPEISSDTNIQYHTPDSNYQNAYHKFVNLPPNLLPPKVPVTTALPPKKRGKPGPKKGYKFPKKVHFAEAAVDLSTNSYRAADRYSFSALSPSQSVYNSATYPVWSAWSGVQAPQAPIATPVTGQTPHTSTQSLGAYKSYSALCPNCNVIVPTNTLAIYPVYSDKPLINM